MIFTQIQKTILDKAAKHENLIILGQPLTGKTTLSVQILLNKINNNENNTLILVPNNTQAKQTNKLISEKLENTTKGILVRTPASFALHIAEIWNTERIDPIPPPEVTSVAKQNILIKEIIESNFNEISKKLHSDFINTDEFSSATIDAIELCEDYNISPELLKKWGKELSKPNWELLAKILEEINERIDAESKTRTQGRVISANRIQYYASELLENWETQKYIHQVNTQIPLPKCVIVEDIQNYTAATFNLLKVLKKLGSQIIITASPDQSVRKTLGNKSKEIFKLSKELDIPIQILKEQYVPNQENFELQKHLSNQLSNNSIFNYRDTKQADFNDDNDHKTNNETGNVDIKIFKNEHDEHTYISKIIREKNITENVPLKEITIIVPNKTEKKITQDFLQNQNIKCEIDNKNNILNKSNLIRTILETIITLEQIQTILPAESNEKITISNSKKQGIKLDSNFAEKIIETINNNEKNFTETIINLATSSLVGIDRQSIKRIELILQNTFIKNTNQLSGNTQTNTEKNLEANTEENIELKAEEKIEENNLAFQSQNTPSIINLIFSNEIETFFESNKRYFPPKILQQLKTLQRILVETYKVINHSKTDVEKTLWTLWENARKATQWQNQVLAEEEGYEKLEAELDNLIILFDEAFWWSKRHQRGTTTKFAKEKLAQEIETDTVAKLGVKPTGIKILTPEETVGITTKHVIIRGIQKNTWPKEIKNYYVYETDILNQLLRQEITIQELSTISNVTKIKMMREENWQRQISILLQAIRTSTQTLLFTAIESETTVPSIFIKIINDVLDKPIYADEDSENIYIHQKPARTLDLQSHITILRKELAKHDNEHKENIVKIINVLNKHGVYGADYYNWHRQLPITNFKPAIMQDEEFRVGPSTLDSVYKCPLNWFLQSKAGGADPSGQNQLIGDFIHAIAEKYPNIETSTGENVEEKIRQEAADKIQELGLSDSFFDKQKLKNINQLVENYIEYIKLHPEYIETEKRITGILTNNDGKTINISGSVDRVEHVEDGKVIIADLKTSGKVPGKKDVESHTQLGVYQLVYNESEQEKSSLGARIIPLAALHEETGRVKRVHFQTNKNQEEFSKIYDEIKTLFSEKLDLKIEDLTKQQIREHLDELKETDLSFYVGLDEKIEEIYKVHHSPILIRKPQQHKECVVCRILSESGQEND